MKGVKSYGRRGLCIVVVVGCGRLWIVVVDCGLLWIVVGCGLWLVVKE